MLRQRLWLAGLVVLVAGIAAGSGLLVFAAGQNPGQKQQPGAQPPVPPVPGTAQADSANPVEAGVRQATAAYVKAFNAHDAKAAAALWTADGEYVGVDGVVVRGREAIEKSFAEEFKAFPKTEIQVKVTAVRPLGRQTAMTEGLVTAKLQPGGEAQESRYSALQVFEDGTWKAASVREWVADPEAAAATKLLDFLAGQWTSKGHGGVMAITYKWNDGKTFLTGHYSIMKDGKTTAAGTEVLTQDPNGGVRSWTFDNSGTFSEARWQRDGDRWFDEAVGILPGGIEVSSTNLLIPLGPDAFSWQVMDRTADGSPLPPLPPVKVTRVKPEAKQP
jgi:uncharacterized protein (TIGR02246 family)